MSAADVERVRRGYAAVVAGDLSLMAEMLDPQVKWHGGDPSMGCQDREQVVAVVREAASLGCIGELIDVFDGGDCVVVVMQPPGDGASMPGRRANVTSFRDGLVVEIVAHESPEAACAAAGIPLR